MRIKLIRQQGNGKEIEIDMDQAFDDAWDAVDPDVKRRAVESLKMAISPEDFDQIRAGIDKHGKHEWIHKDPFDHHFFGMRVRNWLRVNANIKDAELPGFDAFYGEGTDVRNWDDFYVQALEAAAGRR